MSYAPTIADGPLPFKGRRLWGLIFTTCRQPTGAPILDDAFINDAEGWRYTGKALLLTPWRKNRYGEHEAQRAFVIGRRTGTTS